MHQKKGFTLAELLIIVAVTTVLIAIAIPIFTSQREKSRESTDLANVRAAYAEIMTEANSDASGNDKKIYSHIVTLEQKNDGWQTSTPITVGGIKSTDRSHWKNAPKPGYSCLVSYSAEKVVVFNWAYIHPFTSYRNYLKSIEPEDLKGKFYAGYLIKDPTTGAVSYYDSLQSGFVLTTPPLGSIAYVSSTDGIAFEFSEYKDGIITSHFTHKIDDAWDDSRFTIFDQN